MIALHTTLYVGNNSFRILVPGIVIGKNYVVCQPLGYGTHLRTLATIAVATTPENTPE